MPWKIECVIKEMKPNASGNMVELQVKGAEGYLLKQGGKEYNVFCDGLTAQLCDINTQIQLNQIHASLVPLLTQIVCSGKSVRLEFENIAQDLPNMKLQSVTLLA